MRDSHRASSWRTSCCLGIAALVLAACGATVCAPGQDLDFGSQQARQAPEWFAKASIYELWLDAFSKEGNLRGAIPGLQHVADLGASIIYLGPIAKRSAEPDASPYSIADYNEVDPESGSAQDLRDFVSAAHKLHLKVMLDIVYYHTAPDSSMMQADRSFFAKNEEGQIVRGFWPQPLPDFRNPAARKYLIDSLVHWVRDYGVDGFRCDVGGGVPVDFWNDARKALDQAKPEVILLSESDRPDDQLQAFDLNYNFQWYLALRSVLRDGVPASSLRENWETMHATMPRGARLMHYTDNHDWPRSVLLFGEGAAFAASVLDFTLDGVPFLYNGQEVEDPMPTSWRRPLPIRWPKARSSADGAESVEDKYKKLFHLRSSEPAIFSGEVRWINNSEPSSVLSFLRKAGTDEVLVMVNLSNRALHVTLDLPVMDYYVVDNLVDPGKTWFQLYSGRVSQQLPAFGYVVGKKVPLALLQTGAAPAGK